MSDSVKLVLVVVGGRALSPRYQREWEAQCLDMLRSRKSRREEPVGQQVPDQIWDSDNRSDPEHEALLVDSVGRALLVVLGTLAPAERIAFVLHDMFAMPFDQIAPIVGRSPVTTKKLASRAPQGTRHNRSSRRRARPALARRRCLPRCLARRRHQRASRGVSPRRRAPG